MKRLLCASALLLCLGVLPVEAGRAKVVSKAKGSACSAAKSKVKVRHHHHVAKLGLVAGACASGHCW